MNLITVDTSYEWNYTVLVLLCLAYFTWHNVTLHLCSDMCQNFPLKAEWYFIICIYNILLSTDGPFGVADFWLWWIVTVWGNLSQLLLWCVSQLRGVWSRPQSPSPARPRCPWQPWCPQGRPARPDWAGPLFPATLQSHSCHLKLDVYGWGTGC